MLLWEYPTIDDAKVTVLRLKNADAPWGVPPDVG